MKNVLYSLLITFGALVGLLVVVISIALWREFWDRMFPNSFIGFFGGIGSLMFIITFPLVYSKVKENNVKP